MTNLKLYTELSTLPPAQKKEVAAFIQSLKAQEKNGKPLAQRNFGAAKGFFKMSNDFDEPLEDFNEYM